MGVSVCDKKVDTVRTFANSYVVTYEAGTTATDYPTPERPKQQVLIVGYERLRTVMYS